MSKEKKFIKNFQNQVQNKKDGYINSYIEKNQNIDPKERVKINNLKIKNCKENKVELLIEKETDFTRKENNCKSCLYSGICKIKDISR